MRLFRTLIAAAGMGLLFAWMESIFLQYGLLQRLVAKGYEGRSPVVLFLAVHSLTYLVAAFFSPDEKDLRVRCLASALLMVSLPVLLGVASYLPSSLAVLVAVSGMLFSAIGAALLIGRWGMFLSTLIPDDVALVFGLAPLFAAFIVRFTAFSPILILILGAPLLTAFFLLILAEEQPATPIEVISTSRFPFWRLAVFLFCLYVANGFLLSLIPTLFPVQLPRADQMVDWTGTLSSLGVAAVFRFYPGAELRAYYKGSFPFIIAALFLLLFSPFLTLSRFLMETGLAFLDLYAWLLLVYFASRAGKKRSAIIHGGLFLIVLAGAAAHLHLLLRIDVASGSSDFLSFALPGVCFLLLLLVLWDGREVPFQREGGDTPESEKRMGEETAFLAGESALSHEKNTEDKDTQMLLRMRLLEFNLTRQETEIALLLLQGLKDRNICSSLYISQNTLKYHLRNIYRKTGSANRLKLKEILA